MCKQLCWLAGVLVCWGMSVSLAEAGHRHWRCQPVCAPITMGCYAPVCEPTYQTVEKTIYVPQVTWETRVVPVTACRPEVRQRTVTVPNMVPEVRQVTRQYTVMKPVYSTQTLNYTIQKPVTDYVQQTYCISVPYQETRQCMRTVCQQVPYTETSYVCVDEGGWQERTVATKPCRRGCGSCTDCAPTTCRVWVPNIVKKPVQTTCYRTEYRQEPYTATVTLYRPETRTRTVPVTRYVPEARTRQVTCTNFVPEMKTRVMNETSYRCEMVEKVENYTVMAPYTTEKTISVPVCQMVPKVVTCQVPCYP